MKHIQYLRLIYRKDSKFKYYNIEGPDKVKLSLSISIQQTIKKDRIGSPLVVMDRIAKKFITGLKPIYGQWHYGDLYRQGVKDYLIFLINFDRVEVFYFENFYPQNRDLFNQDFINQIKKAGV
jgi:hypothetical protein